MATFEGYERREAKILSVLKEYGINSIDERSEEHTSELQSPEASSYAVFCLKPSVSFYTCTLHYLSLIHIWMQNACRPMPIAAAASAAFVQPILIAIAQPTV